MSTLLKVGQTSVGQTSVGQMSVAEKSRHHKFEIVRVLRSFVTKIVHMFAISLTLYYLISCMILGSFVTKTINMVFFQFGFVLRNILAEEKRRWPKADSNFSDFHLRKFESKTNSGLEHFTRFISFVFYYVYNSAKNILDVFLFLSVFFFYCNY